MNPEPSTFLLGESDQNPAMEVKGNSEEEKEDSTGLTLPNGSEQPPKRGRGRPLGSVNKTPKPVRIPGKRGRPRKVDSDTSMPVKSPGTDRKRGRPSKVIKMRGRPRKTPLTPEEEEERKKMKGKPKAPRVWKPLGRPRIYPREEPPVSPSTSEPRGRGRPRKVQSKQGAHLRKNPPLSSTPQSPAPDGAPRKRGRPPGSFKNSPAKKGPVAKNESSPPPSKRSRQSSGKVDEPREEKSANAEEDTGDSQNERSSSPEPGASGDRAEAGDPTEGEEESVPVVGQRRRRRPRGAAGQAVQEHQGEEAKAARKTGSGKKVAVSKKTAAGKGSENEKPGRESISSIL